MHEQTTPPDLQDQELAGLHATSGSLVKVVGRLGRLSVEQNLICGLRAMGLLVQHLANFCGQVLTPVGFA